MQALVAAGRIRRWGVSNLDTRDMQELWRTGGEACAVDQVLYNVTARGPEFELMPELAGRGVPVMAYSPIAQGRLPRSAALEAVAARHEATPFQIALAWTLRDPAVIAIPKAASDAHVRDNRRAADIVLTVQDLAEIDAGFPPPRSRTPLAML